MEERGASRAPRQVGELDFAGLLARDETREPETDSYSYETFLDTVREFCGEMARRPAELGELIPVGRSRLNFWLKRAVSENKLEKLSKPVRYQWINQDFSSYESFLERAREFCGNEARRPAELGKMIPVSRSRLNAWLRQGPCPRTSWKNSTSRRDIGSAHQHRVNCLSSKRHNQVAGICASMLFPGNSFKPRACGTVRITGSSRA